jgi:acyl phosphate:glycerol-3-phosphate acyltransferase
MQIAVVVLAAYLLGSASFAIVVSRALRLPDPRSYGSGNPGATNVLRTGRKAAAVLTLLGDAGKGWLAVWLASLYSGETALSGVLVPAAGLAAFLGHLFPLYHRFRGGKGVATAGGVLLGLNMWLGAATVLTWIAMAVIFRYSSLAALVAALFAPAYAFWLFGLRPVLAIVLAIAALLVWRHKGNILRLVAGQEQRIGAKTKAESPEAPR